MNDFYFHFLKKVTSASMFWNICLFLQFYQSRSKNTYLALINRQVWKKCFLLIEKNRIRLWLGIRDGKWLLKYFKYFCYFDVQDHNMFSLLSYNDCDKIYFVVLLKYLGSFQNFCFPSELFGLFLKFLAVF